MNTIIPYGRKIKILRIIRGWLQHDLARVSGVTRETIARLETTHRASKKAMQKLEAAFGVGLNSPPVEAAFVILSTPTARAEHVRLALAILEHTDNGQ